MHAAASAWPGCAAPPPARTSRSTCRRADGGLPRALRRCGRRRPGHAEGAGDRARGRIGRRPRPMRSVAPCCSTSTGSSACRSSAPCPRRRRFPRARPSCSSAARSRARRATSPPPTRCATSSRPSASRCATRRTAKRRPSADVRRRAAPRPSGHARALPRCVQGIATNVRTAVHEPFTTIEMFDHSTYVIGEDQSLAVGSEPAIGPARKAPSRSSPGTIRPRTSRTTVLVSAAGFLLPRLTQARGARHGTDSRCAARCRGRRPCRTPTSVPVDADLRVAAEVGVPADTVPAVRTSALTTASPIPTFVSWLTPPSAHAGI